MQYRTLGGTGTVVSAQCLGTMTFGQESSEEVAHAQLDRYVEAGGNLVDTADVYSRGVSEEIIGRWLAARPGMRERLVIATKGRFPMGEGPNDAGLSRAHLTRALEASLRRLQLDHVDLYQAHAWDPLTPIEETLAFLDDAVRAGKIRYAGVSNFVGWQLQKAALLTRFGNLAPIVTLQPQYNLLTRDIEFELVDVCRNENIGILPWSPLAGGWLTGKYRRDSAPDRGLPARRGPGARDGGLRAAQRPGAHLAGDRRGAPGRRGARGVDVAGGAGLGGRPARGDLGDPRGAHGRAARGQPRRRRPAPVRRRRPSCSTETSAPAVADYPYGRPGVQQRGRALP